MYKISLNIITKTFKMHQKNYINHELLFKAMILLSKYFSWNMHIRFNCLSLISIKYDSLLKGHSILSSELVF